jgi:hypothetical protein
MLRFHEYALLSGNGSVFRNDLRFSNYLKQWWLSLGIWWRKVIVSVVVRTRPKHSSHMRDHLDGSPQLLIRFSIVVVCLTFCRYIIVPLCSRNFRLLRPCIRNTMKIEARDITDIICCSLRTSISTHLCEWPRGKFMYQLSAGMEV